MVWWWWCGGVVVWWWCVGGVVVVVRTLCLYDVSVHATQLHAMSWVAGHPRVRLPPTSPPLPRPNGGGSTLVVYLCTRPLKDASSAHHSHDELPPPADELQLRNLDKPLTWPTRARQQPCPRASTNCGNSTVFCTVSTIRHLSLHNDGHEPCPRMRAESSRFSALSGQPNVLHRNGQDNLVQERVRKLHDFLHCLDRLRHLSTHNNGHVNNVEELHGGITGFCTVCTARTRV